MQPTLSSPARRAPRGPLIAGALAAAALLAVSAWVVRRKTAEAEANHPPRGRFIVVQGVRLHYTEHGDPAATPLVLLHGNGAMSTEMELSGLVERAAEHYRVIVFDRPGYGHSQRPPDRLYTPELQADLLLRALELIGAKRPVVLGHSWGAMVALAMGLQRPEAVRGLALVSGYYTPSLRLDVPWMSLPALPLLGSLLRHTVSPLVSRALWPLMVRRLFGPAATPPAFAAGYPVWMSLRPGQLRASAAESALMIPASVRLLGQQHALRVPLAIVAGAKDRLVMTAWHSRRLHRRVAGSGLDEVEQAGHMVHHTAPETVLAAIDRVAGASRADRPTPWRSTAERRRHRAPGADTGDSDGQRRRQAQ